MRWGGASFVEPRIAYEVLSPLLNSKYLSMTLSFSPGFMFCERSPGLKVYSWSTYCKRFKCSTKNNICFNGSLDLHLGWPWTCVIFLLSLGWSPFTSAPLSLSLQTNTFEAFVMNTLKRIYFEGCAWWPILLFLALRRQNLWAGLIYIVHSRTTKTIQWDLSQKQTNQTRITFSQA